MKITKEQLKQIIKEELEAVMAEETIEEDADDYKRRREECSKMHPDDRDKWQECMDHGRMEETKE